MNTELDSTISAFTTIWLTIVSGIILVSTAQSYWRMAIRYIQRSKIPALWSEALDKLPVWVNYLGFAPAAAILFVVIPIGAKIVTNSSLDTLLRIQVSLALGVVAGRLAMTIAKRADARTPPFKRIYFVPIAVVMATLALGTYVSLFKCPEGLAEQWWTPCFN